MVTSDHFIGQSTKMVIFSPDSRFWDDYMMRLFTPESDAESSIHSPY